jgi:hypothetical protein
VQPVMIRVYEGGNKGATAFFRNRAFLATLLESLRALGRDRVRVFVHAASVGAEPYSLLLNWLHRYRDAFDLEVWATDINAHFLAAARQGIYPPQVGGGLTDEERSWFVQVDGNLVIPEQVRERVHFLPPMDFVRDEPEGVFDAVLIMNALTYVTPEAQRTAIGLAARHTDLLALTAFHPDGIRADLEGVGFEPLLRNHEAIHQGWGDRLGNGPVDPASPDYSWKLPPYDASRPDSAYRFGAIFVRRPGATA